MASVGVTVAVAAVVAVVVVVLAAELRARVCEVGEEGEVGGGEQAVERHGAPVERGAGMARKDHRGAGDARSHALGPLSERRANARVYARTVDTISLSP